MKENILLSATKIFAIDIINLCNNISYNKNSNKLFDQLLRSGTGIGANVFEGNYASSKADFINKFQIALKECYETSYWLEIFKDTDMINEEIYDRLIKQCNKIRIMLSSSINTARNNIK